MKKRMTSFSLVHDDSADLELLDLLSQLREMLGPAAGNAHVANVNLTTIEVEEEGDNLDGEDTTEITKLGAWYPVIRGERRHVTLSLRSDGSVLWVYDEKLDR